MVNNLIWAAVGAAVNAIATTQGSEVEKLSGGRFDKFALGLPNTSPIDNITAPLGVRFYRSDEAFALADLLAAGAGMATRKSALTFLGLGGLAGIFIGKKFLGGQY